MIEKLKKFIDDDRWFYGLIACSFLLDGWGYVCARKREQELFGTPPTSGYTWKPEEFDIYLRDVNPHEKVTVTTTVNRISLGIDGVDIHLTQIQSEELVTWLMQRIEIPPYAGANRHE